MILSTLQNNQIDKAHWDKQLSRFSNKRIYVESWFLDVVSPGWKALIANEYEALFPLPEKKKFGIIPYLMQPKATQQLGLFCQNDFSEESKKEVFNTVKQHYKFIRLNINSGNMDLGLKVEIRPNLILKLDKTYHQLHENYNKDALKNLRKSSGGDLEKCEFTADFANKMLDAYQSQYGEKVVNDEYRSFIKNLFSAAQEQGKLLCYHVSRGITDLYFACLLKDENRIYYSFGSPTIEGRKENITHYFIDSLIRKFAESGLILDFEGSAIPNVARFYNKWGSEREDYGFWRG